MQPAEDDTHKPVFLYSQSSPPADSATTTNARNQRRVQYPTLSFAKFSLRLTPVPTLSGVATMRVEARDLLPLVTEREVGAGAWRTCWAMNGVPTNARPGAASNERHTPDTIGDTIVSKSTAQRLPIYLCVWLVSCTELGGSAKSGAMRRAEASGMGN